MTKDPDIRLSQAFRFAFMLLIVGLFFQCKRKEIGTPTVPTEKDLFVRGVDLSYTSQIEDHGGIFKQYNKNVDPYSLLKTKGANMVRLRLWHNPEWIKDIYGEQTKVYSGLAEVTKDIQRAKRQKLEVLLDFHYSDTWADPAHQEIPKAWRQISSLKVLKDSIYQYTFKTLDVLDKQDLLPEMVQLGNEINHGFLYSKRPSSFPNLSLSDGQWSPFGEVMNSAIQAVRDIERQSQRKIKIALHIADPNGIAWWFEKATTEGKVTDFDIIGFSYYHIWHTEIPFKELGATIKKSKERFQKEVMILETAYPFTTQNNDTYPNLYYRQDPVEGYNYTIAGQKAFMSELLKESYKAGALGVFYWAPEWISSSLRDLWGEGSSWENCALFDFNGEATDAINYLNTPL